MRVRVAHRGALSEADGRCTEASGVARTRCRPTQSKARACEEQTCLGPYPCYASATPLLCLCYASAMPLLCLCYASAMPLLCLC